MNKMPALLVLAMVLAVFTPPGFSQEVSWSQLPGTSGKVFDVLQVFSSERIFAGANDTLFVSTDNGLNWRASLPCSNRIGIARSPGGLIAVGIFEGAYCSLDTGHSWSLPVSRPVGYFSSSLCIDRDGYIYLGQSDLKGVGVFRSSDKGGSWIPMTAGLTDTKVTTMLATPSGGVYAGAGAGGIFFSTDNGGTWNPKGFANHNKNALAVDGNGILFAAAGEHSYSSLDSGVYRSTNQGATWAKTTMPMLTVSCLGALSASSTWIFAGGYDLYNSSRGGVYHSTDAGVTWKHDTTGFSATAAYSIAFDSGGHVLVSTDNGIFRSTRSIVTSLVTPGGRLQAEVGLYQNYPNPFNPSTTIRYGLTARSEVTLTVFNILGQAVATLVTETQEAGYHEVRLDGTGLASGVYLYRLSTGDYVVTKRLVVLR
jgi:hypothetical protein